MNNVRSSWSEHKFSPNKMYGSHNKYHQKLSILLNAVIEKQSIHFICIIYPGEHNGTVHMKHAPNSQSESKFRTKYVITATLRLMISYGCCIRMSDCSIKISITWLGSPHYVCTKWATKSIQTKMAQFYYFTKNIGHKVYFYWLLIWPYWYWLDIYIGASLVKSSGSLLRSKIVGDSRSSITL